MTQSTGDPAELDPQWRDLQSVLMYLRSKVYWSFIKGNEKKQPSYEWIVIILELTIILQWTTEKCRYFYSLKKKGGGLVRFWKLKMSFRMVDTLKHAYVNGKITILFFFKWVQSSQLGVPFLSSGLLFHHWFYLLPGKEIKHSNYSHSFLNRREVYFPITSNESYVCVPQGARTLQSFKVE